MSEDQDNTQEQPGGYSMKTYIGCKVIQACPMDENSFKVSQGRPITEGEGNAGYMVEYPDGYISWSPKLAFEVAYRLVTASERDMCK